jgi:hypothetical protein
VKTDFVTPTFQGNRFLEHSLPIEFAKDLAAYGDLVLEVAKYLYFKDHPDRKRVPKGFDDEFNLHLDRIEEGSTLPVLALVTAGMLVHVPNHNTTYFEKARDTVVEWVEQASSGQNVPNDVPPELFEYFNVFGRSLQPGESIKLSTPTRREGVLTPESRKVLALRAKNVYEDNFVINGSVSELDLDKNTFRLKVDGADPLTVPFDSSKWKLFRDALGMSLWRATVKGTGEFNRENELQKIISTEQIQVVPNYAVVSQFEELRGLRDGWCHAQSKAPNAALLEWAAGQVEESYPAELGLPLIASSPEGNLFIEWTGISKRVSAEISYPSFGCEAQSVNVNSGDETSQSFDLTHAESWNRLYEFVRSQLHE